MEETSAVAAIAHDMRTPLAIILGLCERLEDGELEGQAAADVGRVKANAEQLARDFERLIAAPGDERAAVAPPPAAVDLTALTWRVTADLRVLARARGQELRIPPAPAVTVLGSEAALRSVVSNLVGNALRHAPTGGVVRCAVSVRGDRVRLEVADDGPGIPVDERESILEPFARGASATADDGGHGLGLAIVRRVVDEHHGRLSIGTRAGGRGAGQRRAAGVRPVGSAPAPGQAVERVGRGRRGTPTLVALTAGPTSTPPAPSAPRRAQVPARSAGRAARSRRGCSGRRRRGPGRPSARARAPHGRCAGRRPSPG